MIKLIWTLYPFVCSIVIDGIYEALGSFGFDGGNVLEPAMGIGNFFGRMPEDMQSHSQLYGVEIDSLSGRIAQALYPDADIAIQGFEQNRFQNSSFDVAVGNVPFGELGFRDTVHDTTKLHDFFFAEALDKLKNGGIVPPKAVEHVDTALEALTLSIAEKARVDFEYMSSLTGMTEDELKHDLVGEIFKIPHTENTYQTASEYLSGDIRAKLREAEEIAEYDADFNINVSALKQAMPEPLKAGDIDVKLGATWIDPKYYEQFMYELLQTPAYQRSDSPSARWNKSAIVGVEYSVHANSFHVSNKSADRSVLATQKYGTHKMNAYDIFEHLLNLQEPKVYKTIEVPDGLGDTKEKRVVDIDATRVVQRKADDIRKAFKAWIFKDPQRREAIVEKYNELFNSIRPREYDGSALSFPMMTSDIKLHDHQKNAIAHAMFGGNTLFAHCVGAGKTFEMIATAMESKRLGLCTKSLFAVPNHLTEQIGDDFQKLYPGANILVATKKDFKKENRQQLFAKIATGNYDAIIIGHSQLGKIPVSKERQVMTISMHPNK